jgi:hypothetical protein
MVCEVVNPIVRAPVYHGFACVSNKVARPNVERSRSIKLDTMLTLLEAGLACWENELDQSVC